MDLLAQNIIFGVLALVVVVGGIRVVTTQNIVHAALWLVVALAGVGANYFLLLAEFVGVAQILVYLGAIVVVFLFGIMLTRAQIGREHDLDSDQKGIAAAVSVLLLGLLAYVLVDGFGDDELPMSRVGRSAEVGDVLFASYIVPFMAVSVLLLAALVGAIVLARRD